MRLKRTLSSSSALCWWWLMTAIILPTATVTANFLNPRVIHVNPMKRKTYAPSSRHQFHGLRQRLFGFGGGSKNEMQLYASTSTNQQLSTTTEGEELDFEKMTFLERIEAAGLKNYTSSAPQLFEERGKGIAPFFPASLLAIFTIPPLAMGGQLIMGFPALIFKQRASGFDDIRNELLARLKFWTGETLRFGWNSFSTTSIGAASLGTLMFVPPLKSLPDPIQGMVSIHAAVQWARRNCPKRERISLAIWTTALWALASWELEMWDMPDKPPIIGNAKTASAYSKAQGYFKEWKKSNLKMLKSEAKERKISFNMLELEKISELTKLLRLVVDQYPDKEKEFLNYWDGYSTKADWLARSNFYRRSKYERPKALDEWREFANQFKNNSKK